MKKLLLYLFLLLVSLNGISQDYRYEPGDTVKTKYPYSLPIFGNFLHDVGVDLPYPVGIMGNFFYGVQDILITDIAIGVKGARAGGVDIPLTDITRIIEFSEVKATAFSLNVRPDIWILPFLNLYGIIGKAWAVTDVNISYPIEIRALAELDGMSFGIGGTFAGGVGKYFAVLDINKVWTYMSNFDEPVGTSVISPRFGRTFPVGKNPESNIGFWIGAMRISMGGITNGVIALKDVLPQEVWDNLDNKVDDFNDWYDSNPARWGEKPVENLKDIVDGIAEDPGGSTIQYSLAKEPLGPWNMVIGGQYQYNKHWQFRAEGGVIGNRKSLLISGNYRFGIAHK
jgi:hypothetical protein